MTEVQTGVEMNIALAQNAQGAKVVFGLDTQDVIEHSEGAGVGFWKVTEMFVERSGSALKVVRGSEGFQLKHHVFGWVLYQQQRQPLRE